MNLEYFISSLPMLVKDGKAPFAPSEFIAQCDSQLGGSLADAVRALLTGVASDDPFVREWTNRETQIRNACARRRAAKRGQGGTFLPRPFGAVDARIEQEVAAAFDEGDPLKREHALNAIRWRIADEFQGSSPFSRNAVCAYAVKLAIAYAESSADAKAGADKFDEIVSGK